MRAIVIGARNEQSVCVLTIFGETQIDGDGTVMHDELGLGEGDRE